MTAVKKLECTGCASPLEMKPGINRITCKFCGSSYIVSSDDVTDTESYVIKGDHDNPADVILKKADINNTDLNIYSNSYLYCMSEKADAGETLRKTESDYYWNDRIQKLNSNYEKLKPELDRKVKLFAAISYLSGERYDLDVGRIVLNEQTLKSSLYKNKNERKNDPLAISPDEIKSLKELNIKDKNADKFIALKNRYAEELISNYKFSYNDVTKYQSPTWGYENVPRLIGRDKTLEEMYTIRYTERTLCSQMTPELAREVLSSNEIDMIDKIKDNHYVDEVSSEIYDMLSKLAGVQLSVHSVFPIRISIHENGVYFSFGDPKRKIEHIDTLGLLEKHASHQTYTRFYTYKFKEYGMKDIDDPLICEFVLASIFSRINKIAGESQGLRWGMSTVDMNYSWSLICETRSEGVYNDWV